MNPGSEASKDGDREYWIFDSQNGWTCVRNPDPEKAVMDYGPAMAQRPSRYETISTWISPDEKERVRIVRRWDGVFQFSHENWYRSVDEGQLIAEGWGEPWFSSGLFADAELAEQNATVEYRWLTSARRQDER